MEGLQTEGAQQSTLAGRGGGSGGQTEVLLPRSSCIPHHVPPCSHAHFIKPAWSLSLRFPSLVNVAMQWHCVCACTYGCESWNIKKAEHRRTDAFELWCWRRLLRVPWTPRRPNQSILKEISPEYALEGLMLKLKLQYFGHLIRITDSLQKTLMLGKTEDRR